MFSGGFGLRREFYPGLEIQVNRNETLNNPLKKASDYIKESLAKAENKK